MKGLLVLGAGGHGKVVAEVAEAAGDWQKIAFLDDRHKALDGTLRWPILGGLDDFSSFRSNYSHAIVAIGDASLRLRWLERVVANGFHAPVLMHPTAWVSPSASLGRGSVVMANAVVQAEVKLGEGSIVNTAASVDHDCIIGNGVHICPGVNLGGDVKVGNGSWLGIGCSVVQGIKIGKSVTVGAGAVVINDIKDGLTVVGIPAKEV